MAGSFPHSILAMLVVAVSGAACFDSSRQGATGLNELAPRNSRPREMIHPAELRRSRAPNAYEVVARLRPEFLSNHRKRIDDLDGPTRPDPAVTGDASGGYPTIYMNGVRLGGPLTLRSISSNIVTRIRYFREPWIPAVYGPDNPGGVIEVTTTR